MSITNFYDFISYSDNFNKITLHDVTFIEYNCPINEKILPIWTPHDYVIHVLNGTKRWITDENTVELNKGDTAYVRKGGHIVEQDFSEQFCLLIFFITDDLKKILLDSNISGKPLETKNHKETVIKLANNISISGYFESIQSYFKSDVPPSNEIASLKLQELILVLATESVNLPSIAEMIALEDEKYSDFKGIMLKNFIYNLSLENYAELTHRSLSTFKRDFEKCFRMSPGKWLIEKRVERAKKILLTTNQSITEVAFESGFENLSHFSKFFKSSVGISPKEYRKKHI